MGLLFYFLGPSFISGIVVFVVSFFVNLFIAKLSASYQKRYMAKQDIRVNLTTESLNNIKNLKIYQWTDIFEQKIKEIRIVELGVLKIKLYLAMLNVSSLYFFSSLLQAVTFSFYIGSGNTLTLSVAYTVLVVFN